MGKLGKPSLPALKDSVFVIAITQNLQLIAVIAMAIYHCNKSEVRRSKGQNAVAASSYISRSKLQFFTTDRKTGEKRTVTYNFSSKKGLVHSVILAPDDAPSWVYDRQELWNRAESSETRENAETARKLTIALPKELTQQQNTELTEHFASECLVSHGMIADINIHYDNPNNPHAHIQMTTRKLLRLENGEVIFGEKGRDWGRRNFLYYYRENVAYFINQYLEKYGHLAKVSHLSHKARGIDLIPTIHEGTAHYIQDSKLRLINEQILKENAAKIRANPKLREIEISKQLVAEDLATENVKESPVQNLTILADGSKQDSEVSSTTSTVEEFNNFSHCL